ncbi:MAG TPA: DNA polymerase III subunit beta [Gemmataceae bacterium]|nr:DNA polymerase III subunit beta [Gemmataceae bacterium]
MAKKKSEPSPTPAPAPGLQMQAHRHGLLAACRLVSAAIPVGSAKPVLRNIKAIANGDRCTLMATDLEIAVRLDVRGIRVSQPGHALLPSARLLAILSETLDEDLHIVTGDHITVRGSTNEFEMPADDPATFPDVPSFDEKSYHEITANMLREMIRRTVFATANDNVRFGATTGVLWELSEKQATLVATDGRRLAVMSAPAKAVNGHATKAADVPVVPAKAMTLLARLLTNPDETVRVAFRKNEVFIQVGETVIYSRLVEGRFPDYKQVIPKDGMQSANLVAGPLNTAIRQASIMAEDDGCVDLRFAKQRLSVKAQGAESGKSNVELPVDYAGKESNVAFNPSYVTEMLRVLEPDASMTLDMNGDRPALFKTPNYQYVVVPLVESKS